MRTHQPRHSAAEREALLLPAPPSGQLRSDVVLLARSTTVKRFLADPYPDRHVGRRCQGSGRSVEVCGTSSGREAVQLCRIAQGVLTVRRVVVTQSLARRPHQAVRDRPDEQ